MSVVRDVRFRTHWSDVADWVVQQHTRDGNVKIYSNKLGTSITVPESHLIVADRGDLVLSLGPDEPTHGAPGSSAAGGSSTPAASSVRAATSPGARGQLSATHDTPRARATDPNSAHEAARQASKALTENQRRVLIVHAQAGDNGYTGDEMAEAMGGEANYALYGPRRPQLVRAGFLELCGMRPNRRGNPCEVFRCTPAGFKLAARWQVSA